MSRDSSARLILIVTGSSLRAEELDRPLAYYLKQRIERQLALRTADGADEPPTHVLVVSDFRWMSDEPLQVVPTISVGGLAVNALAQSWFEDMPVSLAVEDQYCIQMDPDLDEPRASVWGRDNPATQIAVAVFVDRFLPRFLDRAAEPPRLDLNPDHDDDAEDDTDPDGPGED